MRSTKSMAEKNWEIAARKRKRKERLGAFLSGAALILLILAVYYLGTQL